MSILVSESHHVNAPLPIDVTLFGIVMLVSDLQYLKTLSPILVMLSGIIVLVSDSHSTNAPFAIVFVPRLISTLPDISLLALIK